MIEVDEGTFSERKTKGPPLHYAQALPKEPKAVLAIMHGYADHVGRYMHVFGALAELGIGAVAIDFRGHGKTGGERGYCDRFTEFYDDADELYALTKDRAKQAGGAPLFLFGHSFGGLVASRTAIATPREYKGVILSSPLFGLALEVPKVKELAGRVASMIYPKLGLPSGLKGNAMTHDEARAKAYDEDPLVFPKARARWFTEMTDAQAECFRRAGELALPLYMAFGTADPVNSFDAGKRFFDAAGSKDKTFDPREGKFHELLNETDWKDLVEKYAKFVLSHA
jgi:alpha-beta hydrolase superfamily lysophospholipase